MYAPKKNAKDIEREQESTTMDMEMRLYYLLEGWRGLDNKTRATERERDDTRDRGKLLVRKVNKEKGMAR